MTIRGTRSHELPSCSMRSAGRRWSACSASTPEGVELLAKVEWYGPTGSVKDRIYAAHARRAPRSAATLRPGMTIIECTTGNAGIACSAVAADQGLRLRHRDAGGHEPRAQAHDPAYGAELVLTPGAGTDIDLAIDRMREIVATDPERYFFPGEFENPDNPRGAVASGEEIWSSAAAGRRGGGGPGDRRAGSPGSRARSSGTTRMCCAYAVEPAECPLI